MIDPPRVPIEYIPADAPFSAPQRAWLNGFIAGLFAAAGNARAGAPAAPATTLTILYGSQTGTAEALARSLAREAKQRGYEPAVAGMDELDLAALAGVERLLVLCSTHGDGDAPDNAAELVAGLLAADAPRLEHLSFSVLALGDTNYEKFCRCGRDLDRRLDELGAKRIFERVDCDVDVDEPFIRWRDGVLGALSGRTEPEPATERPRRALGSARRVASLVRVIGSVNLNGPGSGKETRHVVLGPGQPGPPLAYEAGDALAIVPHNALDVVAEVIAAAGFTADDLVSDHGEEMPLATALRERYAIGKLTSPVLRAFAERTARPDLLALLDPGRHDDLAAFLHGRELIDLLLLVPHAFDAPQELLAVLPHLAPRLYSIASSPQAHPDQIHLTVSAVRYEAHGRARHGVCSTFLAEAGLGTRMLAYVQENRRFRLPEDPSRPVIMIGPGTGIAPFRAFLEHRRATGARGRTWLFFGDRSAETDFLYRDELRAFQADGVLTRLETAFSRDQAEKVYVQHRMREHARELWSWLEDGAHVYVCGDATHMAKDVDAALAAVVSGHGNRDGETYLQALRKDHRYQRDIY